MDGFIRVLRPHCVTIVAYDGSHELDVTGPLAVFSSANHWLRLHQKRPLYRLEAVSEAGGAVRTLCGMDVLTTAIGEPRTDVDTLLVAGGDLTTAATSPRLVSWVARTSERARRVGSICTGAFLLARAGLLDGRVATTHWEYVDRLEREHPNIRIDRDALYVRDGKLVTSAGVSTGIDLALSLVEEDLHRSVALEIAHRLVLSSYRAGKQSQLSRNLEAQRTEREAIRDAQLFIVENVAADLSVPTLARRARMSTRSFSRHFKDSVGSTPAKYVEDIRLEAARQMLMDRSRGVEEVALRCGFGTAESMRRRFAARIGIAPSAWRERATAAWSHL